MPTGSRVVMLTFGILSIIAAALIAIFVGVAAALVAGGFCSLVFLILQGWRQNRAVLARVAKSEHRAAESAHAQEAVNREMLKTVNAILNELRSARADQQQLVGRLDASHKRQAEMLAQLGKVEQRGEEIAEALRDVSASMNLPDRFTAPIKGDAAPSAPTKSLPHAPEALVVGEDTFLNLRVEASRPAVVLVLDGLDPRRIFAGVATAFLTGLMAADRLERALRVVPLRTPAASSQAVAAGIRAWVRANAPGSLHGCDIEVVPGSSVPAEPFDARDVWIVTYWATAHALAAACRSGSVSPKQVIYLIQDYEPGFFAWGSNHALAAETYRQGFHPLVNSRPLADSLARQTGTPVDPDNVFCPDLDVRRLHDAARAWRPGPADEVRVLFYARPSKPRNMFTLGVAALQRWTELLPDGVRPVIWSAGEDHAPVDLGGGRVLRPLGKLRLDAYYDKLSEVDLGLALMHSPHPGHLSLELPMSGIPTVTNTFADFRTTWVEGLVLGVPTPSGLSLALHAAYRRSHALTAHRPAFPLVDLGRPLDVVLENVLRRVSS